MSNDRDAPPNHRIQAPVGATVSQRTQTVRARPPRLTHALGRQSTEREISAVANGPWSSDADAMPPTCTMLLKTLTRPFPVTIPMVALFALVPFYVFIPEFVSGRTLHVPELALDRVVPLQPSWALLYGSLYLFLIMLPVFIVAQREHIRRTVFAYLMVWIAAYVCFLVYPTVAPRPANVLGGGFGVWGLRLLYSVDPPYNCFPSLHVAHSFVSALACHRVHRGVGYTAVLCASLVAISVLFTKQHYIADVFAGVLMAFVAHVVFLRNYPREKIPNLDRRLAPVVALALIGVVGIGVAGFWVAYKLRGNS